MQKPILRSKNMVLTHLGWFWVIFDYPRRRRGKKFWHFGPPPVAYSGEGSQRLLKKKLKGSLKDPLSLHLQTPTLGSHGHPCPKAGVFSDCTRTSCAGGMMTEVVRKLTFGPRALCLH